jgi:hypothetical protein
MSFAVVSERLDRLEARGRETSLPIHELPGFTLKAPLTVVLTTEEDVAFARLPELDLWMDGATEAEALEDLKEAAASVARTLLQTPVEQLGPRPQTWKRLLERLAVPV